MDNSTVGLVAEPIQSFQLKRLIVKHNLVVLGGPRPRFYIVVITVYLVVITVIITVISTVYTLYLVYITYITYIVYDIFTNVSPP